MVSEEVYCLYTHENVDIFGWPLSSDNMDKTSWCDRLSGVTSSCCISRSTWFVAD